MNPEDLPVVGAAFRFGTPDPFFAWLLLAGPLVLLLIALLGRSMVVETIATLYVLLLPLYVLKKAM